VPDQSDTQRIYLCTERVAARYPIDHRSEVIQLPGVIIFRKCSKISKGLGMPGLSKKMSVRIGLPQGPGMDRFFFAGMASS
jgi:hypothetical protein